MCSELMQTKKKESFARFLFLIVSFFWQVFFFQSINFSFYVKIARIILSNWHKKKLLKSKNLFLILFDLRMSDWSQGKPLYIVCIGFLKKLSCLAHSFSDAYFRALQYQSFWTFWHLSYFDFIFYFSQRPSYGKVKFGFDQNKKARCVANWCKQKKKKVLRAFSF